MRLFNLLSQDTCFDTAPLQFENGVAASSLPGGADSLGSQSASFDTPGKERNTFFLLDDGGISGSLLGLN